MAWQDAFSAYATSTAFAVSISKAQVRALNAIENDTWRGDEFTMFYLTAGALERKGLCEYNHAYRGRRDAPWLYRLTPAGKLVLDLVRMSGALPNDAALPTTEAA